MEMSCSVLVIFNFSYFRQFLIFKGSDVDKNGGVEKKMSGRYDIQTKTTS